MIDNWKKLVDEYSEHNKFLSESIKDKNKRITGLKERVEELEKDYVLLINKNNIHVDFANEYYANYQFEKVENKYLKTQNERYKQALEYTQSELEYAHVTGNMNLRNDLIKKSLKAIDKALAGDNS